MQRKWILALTAVVLLGLVVAVLRSMPDADETEVVAAPEVAPVVEAPTSTVLPEVAVPEVTRQPAEPKWVGLDADLERFGAKPAEAAEESNDSVMKDADLWYRFVDAETLAPIADVEVRTGAMGYSFSGVALVTSDADGLVGVDRYFVKSILAVHASGYGPIRLRVEPGLARAAEARVVELERGATLVVRFEGRAPTAGAPPGVVLTASGYDLVQPPSGSGGLFLSMPHVERSATADEAGECRIEDLPTGVPIEAKVPELRFELKEPLELSPGEVRLVTWKAAGAGRILGSLVDGGGKPIAGRQLVLVRPRFTGRPESHYLGWQRSTEPVARERTDAQGRFRFEGLPLDDYYVGPTDRTARGERMWDELAPVSALVVLSEAEPVAEVALVAHRGLYFEGVVVDPEGQPVPRVQVWASGALGTVDGRTDAAGGFRLGPVEPVAHKLHAFGGGEYADSNAVTAEPGAQPLRLVLKLGGALTGRVVDAATGEPCDATLWRSGTARYGFGWSRPPRATFSYSGLLPDTYTVAAKTADGRIGFRGGLELHGGDRLEDLVVSVAPGATLRAKYAGPLTGVRCGFFVDGSRVGFETLMSGETVDVLVPPGTISIRVERGDEDLAVQTVEVHSGEVRDVTIEHE